MTSIQKIANFGVIYFLNTELRTNAISSQNLAKLLQWENVGFVLKLAPHDEQNSA